MYMCLLGMWHPFMTQAGWSAREERGCWRCYDGLLLLQESARAVGFYLRHLPLAELGGEHGGAALDDHRPAPHHKHSSMTGQGQQASRSHPQPGPSSRAARQ